MEKQITKIQLEEIRSIIHKSIVRSGSTVDVLPGQMIDQMKKILGHSPELKFKKNRKGHVTVSIKDVILNIQ